MEGNKGNKSESRNEQNYLNSCIKHLESTAETGENYYKRADNTVLTEAKQNIEIIVREGLDNEILSRDEFEAMMPAENISPGRFYANFKVHKEYEHGTAPPERAIVSCSGTFTENIATYVEHHL